MLKRQPIVVAGTHFSSKKALQEYVQGILRRYPPGTKVIGEDEMFLRAFFVRHQRYEHKHGVGMHHIEVRKNRYDVGFWIIRVDGSETDISYLSCLAPPTHTQKVKAAMRLAVYSQKKAYRERHLVPGALCSVTGEPLNIGNCHVDHVVPFEDLVTTFLDREQLTIDEVEIEPRRDGEVDSILSDKRLESAWQKYHQQNAVLRLVTKHANLSVLRTSKGNSMKPLT
jgi:hypothetical protein